jgi:hypothetical protein
MSRFFGMIDDKLKYIYCKDIDSELYGGEIDLLEKISEDDKYDIVFYSYYSSKMPKWLALFETVDNDDKKDLYFIPAGLGIYKISSKITIDIFKNILQKTTEKI